MNLHLVQGILLLIEPRICIPCCCIQKECTLVFEVFHSSHNLLYHLPLYHHSHLCLPIPQDRKSNFPRMRLSRNRTRMMKLWSKNHTYHNRLCIACQQMYPYRNGECHNYCLRMHKKLPENLPGTSTYLRG